MNKLLLPTMLAALALAACGNDEPAAPAPEPTPTPVAPEPTPTPTPESDPEAQPIPQVTTLNNEQIGVQPAKNIQDAFNTANKAMDYYCQQEGMDRATFYIKETNQLPDKWRVTFFGNPGNVPMYIYVNVFPDGRYEFER